MSNKAYDIIKTIAWIATPTITFIAAVISIWNIPHGAEITATLAALDTFLGALVVVLKIKYDRKEKDDVNN